VAESDMADAGLVAQVRQGNEAAFEVLLARYQRAVFQFAWRLLGNAADAEDVAQETFVRAYRHLGDYDPRHKFSTWLFTLARNGAIDRLRWRQRHPAEALLADAPLAAPSTVSGEVANRELAEAIAAAVRSLPEDQRTALVLAEYEGLPQAEIGGVMHCSAKAVESRLYRARQSLRSKLAAWL